ncbi:hypothetical protein NKG94_37155 [Micromonospora sp. M12]
MTLWVGSASSAPTTRNFSSRWFGVTSASASTRSLPAVTIRSGPISIALAMLETASCALPATIVLRSTCSSSAHSWTAVTRAFVGLSSPAVSNTTR